MLRSRLIDEIAKHHGQLSRVLALLREVARVAMGGRANRQDDKPAKGLGIVWAAQHDAANAPAQQGDIGVDEQTETTAGGSEV